MQFHSPALRSTSRAEVRADALYPALLALLDAGAVIEEVDIAPLRYCVRHGRDSAPLPGGLVQKLFAHKRLKPTCRVGGRQQYVMA